MRRYIDADALRKSEIERCRCVPCIGSNENNYKDLDEVLNEAPTADVVEVVRCKDCKNWRKDRIEKHTYSSEDSTIADFAECERWSNWSVCRMLRFDDYCSLAERR